MGLTQVSYCNHLYMDFWNVTVVKKTNDTLAKCVLIYYTLQIYTNTQQILVKPFIVAWIIKRSITTSANPQQDNRDLCALNIIKLNLVSELQKGLVTIRIYRILQLYPVFADRC